MTTSGSGQGLYAEAMTVSNVDECEFYHVMEVPGAGLCGGKWDLREGMEQYLGGIDFAGKRVLELGTASGYLCFEMEKRGADVVGFDIGDDQEWDIVPFAQYDYRENMKSFRQYTDGFKKAFWYAHKAFNSKATVVYGSVYDVPKAIGAVDIGTFGCILLHLKDPFRALESALRLVKNTVLVTDLAPTNYVTQSEKSILFRFGRFAKGLVLGRKAAGLKKHLPYMVFLPDYRTLEHKEVWWSLSPEIIVSFLGVLGFEETEVTYHTQELNGRMQKLFTVVGTRTKGVVESAV